MISVPAFASAFSDMALPMSFEIGDCHVRLHFGQFHISHPSQPSASTRLMLARRPDPGRLVPGTGRPSQAMQCDFIGVPVPVPAVYHNPGILWAR